MFQQLWRKPGFEFYLGRDWFCCGVYHRDETFFENTFYKNRFHWSNNSTIVQRSWLNVTRQFQNYPPMYLFYQYTPYLIIILCHFIFDIFYIRIISVETRILKKKFSSNSKIRNGYRYRESRFDQVVVIRILICDFSWILFPFFKIALYLSWRNLVFLQ